MTATTSELRLLLVHTKANKEASNKIKGVIKFDEEILRLTPTKRIEKIEPGCIERKKVQHTRARIKHTQIYTKQQQRKLLRSEKKSLVDTKIIGNVEEEISICFI